MPDEPLFVEVWSDYVCPWCYLMHTSFRKLDLKAEGIDLHLRAYELHPRERPWPESEREAKRRQIAAAFPQLKARAEQEYGVDLVQGPWGVDSRLAHYGAKAAEAMEVGARYHAAVFEAYWLAGRDISDREVLVEIAQGVGLEAEPFRAALDLPEIAEAVRQEERQADRFGVSGVPATVFGGKLLLSGAVPLAALREAVAEARAHLAAHQDA